MKAKDWYAKAASKRDIFSFWAAERLGLQSAMNDKPLVKNPTIYNRILAQPTAYRLKIFLRMGDMTRAAQEYKALTYKMTPAELEQAALFIAENGWHVQAIITLAKNKNYDALKLRFPMLYENQIRQLAQKHGIIPATIYAIIWKQ